jgi:hypothetical protein
MATSSAASFKFMPDAPANNEHTKSATGSHTMSAFAKQIRPYVQAELAAAFKAERQGDQHLAFRRLERAHVLSQGATIEHLRVHGHMLRFALRQGLVREALGQIPRLLLATPLSLVGLIPTGNTGGSNVSGLRPMAVPADLQQIIDGARARAG